MRPRATPEKACKRLCGPNRTLTLRGMTVLFAGLTLVVLTIGIGFTLAGAWPVLPFASLELALAGAVLYRLFRHAADHDRVLDRERVTVIRQRGRRERRDEFQRCGTRVTLEPGHGWHPL